MAVATSKSVVGCTLDEALPDTNLKGGVGGTRHNWGWITKETERNVTMRFDFSGDLPGDAVISAASLFLYVSDVMDDCAGMDHSGTTWPIKRCLRNWHEDQVTWNEYTTGNSWTTGGAMSDGNDVTNTHAVTPAGTDSTGWWEIDLTSMVQYAWSDLSGAFSCVLIRPAINLLEGEYLYYKFRSYTSHGVGLGPYLSITYTSEGGDEFIKKISGVSWANVKKVSGVAEASISKVSGVSAN